jgi:hypothetical protein
LPLFFNLGLRSKGNQNKNIESSPPPKGEILMGWEESKNLMELPKIKLKIGRPI